MRQPPNSVWPVGYSVATDRARCPLHRAIPQDRVRQRSPELPNTVPGTDFLQGVLRQARRRVQPPPLFTDTPYFLSSA